MNAVRLYPYHDITRFISEGTSTAHQGVLYDRHQRRLVATDGRVMMIVPADETLIVPIDQAISDQLPPKSFIMPAWMIREALRPREAGAQHRIGLQFCAATGKVRVACLNEDGECVVVLEGHSIDLEPFNWSQVIPDWSKVTPASIDVRVSANYMSRITSYADEHSVVSGHPLTMRATGERGPIQFDILLRNDVTAVGVLMPMRRPD